MTSGHKHREVRVFDDAHPLVLRAVKVLQTPLYHSSDRDKVDASPYPYGPCEPAKGLDSVCWYLSPLSFLHRWTGLTIRTDEPEEKTDERGAG